MSRFVLLVVILTGLILGVRAANDDPMTTMKSVLKSWHTMYNSYREEVNLGYCWADYFFDIKRFIDALSGPRILGINPDDPAPIVSLLRNWFAPSVKSSDVNSSTSTEPYQEDEDDDDTGAEYEQPSQGYVYPGPYEGGRSLASFLRNFSTATEPYQRFVYSHESHESGRSLEFGSRKERAFGDLFVSLLGLDVPPGYGPLALGTRGPGPLVIIFSKVFGTVIKIGRKVLDTIEKTSILACTKDYLLVKVFRWIDS